MSRYSFKEPCKILTESEQAEIESALKYWVGVLRLTHWRIDLRELELSLGDHPNLARVSVKPHLLTADMYIVPLTLYKNDEESYNSYSRIVLHECLHIRYKEYQKPAQEETLVCLLEDIFWENFRKEANG